MRVVTASGSARETYLTRATNMWVARYVRRYSAGRRTVPRDTGCCRADRRLRSHPSNLIQSMLAKGCLDGASDVLFGDRPTNVGDERLGSLARCSRLVLRFVV